MIKVWKRTEILFFQIIKWILFYECVFKWFLFDGVQWALLTYSVLNWYFYIQLIYVWCLNRWSQWWFAVVRSPVNSWLFDVLRRGFLIRRYLVFAISVLVFRLCLVVFPFPVPRWYACGRFWPCQRWRRRKSYLRKLFLLLQVICISINSLPRLWLVTQWGVGLCNDYETELDGYRFLAGWCCRKETLLSPLELWSLSWVVCGRMLMIGWWLHWGRGISNSNFISSKICARFGLWGLLIWSLKYYDSSAGPRISTLNLRFKHIHNSGSD